MRLSHPELQHSLSIDLFDGKATVVSAPPQLRDLDLTLEENEHIRGASEKRRAEFGTARVCARVALRELGVASASLVPQSDRSPRWPHSVVGSISHCSDLCLVAVSLDTHFRSIGIDVEKSEELSEKFERAICTSGEVKFLSDLPLEQRGRFRKLIFSAKEAFYKCQYPLTGAFLEFQEVEVSFQLDQQRFSIASEKSQIASRVEGRFTLTDAHIMTGAWIPFENREKK